MALHAHIPKNSRAIIAGCAIWRRAVFLGADALGVACCAARCGLFFGLLITPIPFSRTKVRINECNAKENGENFSFALPSVSTFFNTRERAEATKGRARRSQRYALGSAALPLVQRINESNAKENGFFFISLLRCSDIRQSTGRRTMCRFTGRFIW